MEGEVRREPNLLDFFGRIEDVKAKTLYVNFLSYDLRVPLALVLEAVAMGELTPKNEASWAKKYHVPKGAPAETSGINTSAPTNSRYTALFYGKDQKFLGIYDSELGIVTRAISVNNKAVKYRVPFDVVKRAYLENQNRNWDEWFKGNEQLISPNAYLALVKPGKKKKFILKKIAPNGKEFWKRLDNRGNNKLKVGDSRELNYERTKASIWYGQIQSFALNSAALVGEGLIIALEMLPGGGTAGVIVRSAYGEDYRLEFAIADVASDVLMVTKIGKAIKFIPKIPIKNAADNAKFLGAVADVLKKTKNVGRVVSASLDSRLIGLYDRARGSYRLGKALLKAGIRKPLNSVAHHLIPMALANTRGLKTFFVRAVKSGWDMNGASNGKFVSKLLHYNHPKYSRYLEQRLLKWVKGKGGASNVKGHEAKKFLEKLAKEMSDLIDANPGKKIEDIFDWVN